MANGFTFYKGFRAAQHENAIGVFGKLIQTIRPARILEIGTADGGLTVALQDIVNQSGIDCSIRTYDIWQRPNYNLIKDMGIELILDNIFIHDYSNLNPDKIEDVRNFIQSKGITIILCDGRNKISEFRLLSSLLKINDHILAHDYAKSYDHFHDYIKANDIWNWCEITYDDIRESCVSNNLEPYMQTDFESVVWTSWKKIS